GEGEFALSLDGLKAAVRGRDTVSFKYKNTMLYGKSGKYSAELATVDAVRSDTAAVTYESNFKMSSEQMTALRKALGDVALKPNDLISSFMPCGIKMGKKSTFLTCFDTTHLAFTTTEDVTGDTSFVLPLDILLTTTSVF